MALGEFYQLDPKMVNIIAIFFLNYINLMIGDEGDSWETANFRSSFDQVLKKHKPSASSFRICWNI